MLRRRPHLVLCIHTVARARFAGGEAVVKQPAARQHRHPLRRVFGQFRHRDIGKTPLHFGALDRIVIQEHDARGGEFEAIENAREARRFRLPVDFHRGEILRAQHHLGPLGEYLLHRSGVVLAGDRQQDAFAAQSLQKGLQAQEMPAPAGRVEIDAVEAVVADAPAPQRVVKIDDDELAARRDGADERIGQSAEQSRRAIRMERELGGLVKAVVEPGACPRAAHERLGVEQRDPRRNERCAQAVVDRAPPGIGGAVVGNFIGQRLRQRDQDLRVACFQRRFDGSGHGRDDRLRTAQRSVGELDRGERQDHVRRGKAIKRRLGLEQFGAPLVVRGLVNFSREIARRQRNGKTAGEKLRRVVSGQRHADFRPIGLKRCARGFIVARAGGELLQCVRRRIARRKGLQLCAVNTHERRPRVMLARPFPATASPAR